MLFLLCQAAGHRFGIDVRNVVAVLPRVRFQAAVGAPPWLAGLFAHNGRPTPVIDLPFLVGGKPCPVLWSSRIILVTLAGGPGPSAPGARHLGLLTERVDPAELAGPPEELPLAAADLPAWGPIVLHEGELVQILELPRLLAHERQQSLLTGTAATEAL
jgi:chemotaxis-related protein WspB